MEEEKEKEKETVNDGSGGDGGEGGEVKGGNREGGGQLKDQTN